MVGETGLLEVGAAVGIGCGEGVFLGASPKVDSIALVTAQASLEGRWVFGEISSKERFRVRTAGAALTLSIAQTITLAGGCDKNGRVAVG